MPRRVFFSFHYRRDVRRVVQVRNSWVVRANSEAQPFYDKAEWETAKARAGGLAGWIGEQLNGTSVTAVLFGAETYTRPWVIYELRKSHELGKGILAIDIHRINDPQVGPDVAGYNPLDFVHVIHQGRTINLSQIYPTYDWVLNDGYNNMPNWIEGAARAAGR